MSWPTETSSSSDTDQQTGNSRNLPPAPAIFDPVYDAPEWRWAVPPAAQNHASPESQAAPANGVAP
jgi:hypothetical protein